MHRRKNLENFTFFSHLSMFKATFMLGALLFSNVSISSNYAIQIGVFKYPSEQLYERASTLGNLSKEELGEMTRLLVGNYSSYQAAADDLDRVRESGFDDAFIRNVDGKAPFADVSPDSGTPIHAKHSHDSDSVHEHRHGQSSHTHLPRSDQEKLSKLSESERASAVYLDGKLHLKQGDQFIPL